jgi:hypothetical protein
MTKTIGDRYSVKALGTEEGAKWEQIHISFSKTSCEEEYEKAIKKKKYKSLVLLDSRGTPLASHTVGEGQVEQSTQLSLL